MFPNALPVRRAIRRHRTQENGLGPLAVGAVRGLSLATMLHSLSTFGARSVRRLSGQVRIAVQIERTDRSALGDVIAATHRVFAERSAHPQLLEEGARSELDV